MGEGGGWVGGQLGEGLKFRNTDETQSRQTDRQTDRVTHLCLHSSFRFHLLSTLNGGSPTLDHFPCCRGVLRQAPPTSTSSSV